MNSTKALPTSAEIVHVHLALLGLLVLLVPNRGFKDRGSTNQNVLMARNRLIVAEKSKVGVSHLLVDILQDPSCAALSLSHPTDS